MTVYGYARVSSTDQDTAIQVDQLKVVGAENIICETKSGKNVSERDKLSLLLEMLSSGDTLVVTKLDRFSRNTLDTLKLVQDLDAKGVTFKALDIGVDTSTPTGKFAVTIMAAVAELERTKIKERQMEGIAKAKDAGKYKGRKPSYQEHIPAIRKLLVLGYSKSYIAKELGLSRPTLYKAIAAIDSDEQVSMAI